MVGTIHRLIRAKAPLAEAYGLRSRRRGGYEAKKPQPLDGDAPLFLRVILLQGVDRFARILRSRAFSENAGELCASVCYVIEQRFCFVLIGTHTLGFGLGGPLLITTWGGSTSALYLGLREFARARFLLENSRLKNFKAPAGD